MCCDWWMLIFEGLCVFLLNCVEMVNMVVFLFDEDCLLFEFLIDDWKCWSVDFVK